MLTPDTHVADVVGFYDPGTSSIQYILTDPATRCCAIIDPVLDYDEKSGAVGTASADALLAHIASRDLRIAWILDTHPHADHFTAADYLKRRTGAPIATGARVIDVQRLWADIYHLPDFPADGSHWDRLFADDETFTIGNLTVQVLHSPGHTLSSVTYVAGDAAFIHDTLFMPDTGTARADFPGGNSAALWASIQRILRLPAGTRLFTGHDYQAGGRPAQWQSSIADQQAGNPYLAADVDEARFVAMRTARDGTLPMPRLILHALQVNIAGGCLPPPEENGRRYLKIPLDALPRFQNVI